MSVYSHTMSKPDFFSVQEQGEISPCEGQLTDCARLRLVARLIAQINVHKLLSFIFLFDYLLFTRNFIEIL